MRNFIFPDVILCSVYNSHLDGVTAYKEYILHSCYSMDNHPCVQKERVPQGRSTYSSKEYSMNRFVSFQL